MIENKEQYIIVCKSNLFKWEFQWIFLSMQHTSTMWPCNVKDTISHPKLIYVEWGRQYFSDHLGTSCGVGTFSFVSGVE